MKDLFLLNKEKKTIRLLLNNIDEIINNKNLKEIRQKLKEESGINFFNVLKGSNNDKLLILTKTNFYTFVYEYDKISGELIDKGGRKNVNVTQNGRSI